MEHKIQTQISKGDKNPKCNTIRFGDVMGQERAFLIQNMFPVTQKYIDAVYIDKNTKNEVTVSPQVESDVVKNARSILKLSFKHKHLVFGDIQKIYTGLSLELQQQKERENSISDVSAINSSTTTNTQSSALGIQSQYYLMKVTSKEMEALKKGGIHFQPSLKGADENGKIMIRFDKSLKERAVEIIKGTSKQSIKPPPKGKT